MARKPTDDTPPRLPIKVISSKQGKERPVPAGGKRPEPFRKITSSYIASLRTQVAEIEKSVRQIHKDSSLPVPIRVTVLAKAVAKSHRPRQIFSERTCPIVGAGKLGELYLKGTRHGLAALGKKITEHDSPQAKKEISSIETIEIVTPSLRRGKKSARDILRNSPRRRKGYITRVRLFDFGRHDQSAVVEDFEKYCSKNSLPISRSGYSAESFVYGVECRSESEVEGLSQVIGVRSVSSMPVLKVLRPKATKLQALPSNLPEANGDDIPVVVVVDSGVSNLVPGLEKWVVGRDSTVAHKYRNPDHGTFVAGLICWGAQLNPQLQHIDESPCGVFDLQVIPNSDPAHGDVDELTEQELLQSLETALQQYSNRFKVWNLSLGTNELCSLDDFSPLAVQLDDLQEKYQTSFVISAGNFDSPPLLDYPRVGTQLTEGRITTPSDSVLGITVGAISHVDYSKSGPGSGCPTAYSRHGAGPNHIIKPDLVHYGGACSRDLQHFSGIRSIHGKGTAEDLGTSFATPLVSRALARIYHELTPSPSPVMARALLTHHARDPRTGGRVPDGEENFLGFGRPVPAPYCLECDRHSSTLVFEEELRPGYYLEWDDFPYPKSLIRNGRYVGEIWMTVAFAPSRGPRWGTEYCETHVDAHFGVYTSKVNKETGEIEEKFRGLVPPEHKNPGVLYESFQVTELRKWAPVRTYHGDLGKGERGSRWRLKLQLLTRHGIAESDTYRPQKFALIVTISDPRRLAPVYDEMAQAIRTRFQVENLLVRSSTRVRA